MDRSLLREQKNELYAPHTWERDRDRDRQRERERERERVYKQWNSDRISAINTPIYEWEALAITDLQKFWNPTGPQLLCGWETFLNPAWVPPPEKPPPKSIALHRFGLLFKVSFLFHPPPQPLLKGALEDKPFWEVNNFLRLPLALESGGLRDF